MTFAGIPAWSVAGLIVACAALLYALHRLRVRPREVRVITTIFWAQAVEPTRARTLLHRFRHPFTYALLLGICSLLALAMGEPRRTASSQDRIHRVLVLDAGAPMAAPGRDAPTRWSAAVRWAVEHCRPLAAGDRAAVIVADPWPRLVHAFEDPLPLLEGRLAGLAPANLPASLDPAVELARSLVNGRSRPEIFLITGEYHRSARSPGDGAVRVIPIVAAEALANAAILSASFEPDPLNPLVGRVNVRVGYWGPQPRRVTWSLRRAGGAPLAGEERTMPPGATEDFAAGPLAADGDRLIVQLAPADAVAGDDRMEFRLPLRGPVRVSVPPDAPGPLRAALAADPAVTLTPPDQPHEIDVLLGDDERSLPERAAIIVRGDPSRTLPGLAGGARIQVSDAAAWRGVDLAGASCGAGATVAPTGVEPLVTCGEAILAGWTHRGGRRHFLLAPAVLSDDSTLWLRPGFAVLVSRAVRELAGWSDDPVVLTPERPIEDPLWPARAGAGGNVAAAPGRRDTADVAGPPTTAEVRPGAAHWGLPSLHEVLLGAALLLCGLEAVLHARGRIP